MAVVFADDFTVGSDTDIASYPSAGDPDYAYDAGSAGDLVVTAATDRVELTATSVFTAARLINPAAISGDQQVTADVGVDGSFSSGEVRARMQAGADSAYAAKIELTRIDGDRTRLYRVVNGSYTLVASGGPTGITAGGHKLTLRATGTNPVQLTLVVDDDDGNAVTFSDSNAARHESGPPGLGAWRNNSGHVIWVDNFAVDDLAAAETAVGAAGLGLAAAGQATQISVRAAAAGLTLGAAAQRTAIEIRDAADNLGMIAAAQRTAIEIRDAADALALAVAARAVDLSTVSPPLVPRIVLAGRYSPRATLTGTLRKRIQLEGRIT